MVRIAKLLACLLTLCILKMPAFAQNVAKPKQAAAATVPTAADVSKPAVTPTSTPQFDPESTITDGAKTVKVIADKNEVISLYLIPFAPGETPVGPQTTSQAKAAPSIGCNAAGLPNLGLPIDLQISGGTSKTVTMDTTSQVLTLASSITLKTGDKLCLYATETDAKTNVISSYFSTDFLEVQGPLPAESLPAVSFADTIVTGTDTIWVKGQAGNTVSFYTFPASYVPKSNTSSPTGMAQCLATDLPGTSGALALKTAAGAAKVYSIALTSDTQAIQVSDPLESGTQLCIYEVSKDQKSAIYSYFESVTDPKSPTGIAFYGDIVGGTNKFDLVGTSGATVSVYQFDSSYTPQNPKNCSGDVQSAGHRVAIAQSGTGSSASTTTYTVTLSGTAPYTVTLVNPLVAHTQLCLSQTVAAAKTSTDPSSAPTATAAKGTVTIPNTGGDGASTPTFSGFAKVSDPNDFGRVRTSFTAGATINNQQNSAQSSTASQYLDFGLYFNWLRPGGSQLPQKPAKASVANATSNNTDLAPKKPYKIMKPGFDTFFNVKLSAVPVSSQATTTSTSATSTTPETTTSSTVLNVMSSQQNAQFALGAATTWRMTRFFSNTNYFLLGPVARGGFDTLLNPSINNPAMTSGAAAQITVNDFSPIYYYREAGLRLQWAQISSNSDEAPNPFAQVDVTAGDFSNLPSYICDPKKSYGSAMTTQPTTTTCFTTAVPPGSTTPVSATNFYLDASRTLMPRMRVEGFAKLPNYPFVLGMDANLGQYAIGQRVNKIDPLSKPGNSVSIYFGIQIDPLTAFKKLGLSPQ